MLKQQPVVSIVTPSFNQAPFLPHTLASVLGQDYMYVEYLVYDGGSTDGSLEILRQHDERFAYWVSGPDKGQADAINRGWQRSRGEILAWLNSDDTYEPGAVSAVAEVFRNYPEIDVVTSDCRVIDEAGRFVSDLPSGDFDILSILNGNSLPQQGVFCRRAAVEAAGWLDTRLNYVFDWALWLKLWLHGAKFYHLPRKVANFRVWGQAKTAHGTVGASLSGGTPFARERLAVLAELKTTDQVAQNPQLSAMFETAWRGVLLELSLLHQLSGEFDQAENYLHQFAYAGTGVPSPFDHSQALAAHLAYVDGDVDQIIKRLVRGLSSQLGENAFDATSVTKQLSAETLIVQAWHASHQQEYGTASRFFFQAMMEYPVLALQRRVVSPAVKHLGKSMMRKLSQHHVVRHSE